MALHGQSMVKTHFFFTHITKPAGDVLPVSQPISEILRTWKNHGKTLGMRGGFFFHIKIHGFNPCNPDPSLVQCPSGWWFQHVSTNPPEKWWSSSDWIIIPTIGENKKFMFQTTNQPCFETVSWRQLARNKPTLNWWNPTRLFRLIQMVKTIFKTILSHPQKVSETI